MQTLEFLKHIWPDTGQYCIVGKDQQNIVQPKFVTDFVSAEKVISKFLRDKQDIYFAMSSWGDKNNRQAVNAKEQKCLWLDIDCGFDHKKRKYKDYRTKEDGLVALREFTDATKLPQPTIVDSGNGIHCYWTFTDAVNRDIWKPVADGFKFLCIKHKLSADHGCTSDVSRILRVPGTKNFKDIENPKDVIILKQGEHTTFDKIAELVPVELVTKRAKARRPMDEATKAILGNHTSKFLKIINRIREGDGCLQLQHIILNQATLEEPLWRSGLSIATHCEDREIAIHNISKHHPDYNFDKTNEKALKIPGPHSCREFESLRPTGCKSCKHQGNITSPIQLGKVIARAKGSDNSIEARSESLDTIVTYHIPDLPFPYFRGKNGGIYKSLPDDDDDGIQVYEYDFYLVERLEDIDFECAWFKVHLPKDGVKEFIARTSDLLTKEKARAILVDKGIVVHGRQVDLVIEYIVASIKAQQRDVNAAKMQKQYGWNPGDASQKNKILIGNREISAFGIKYSPVSNALSDFNHTLVKKGSYELWKKAISIYERPGMEIRAFGLFCAFGSLLMPFFKSREKSAIVNLYNAESGQGKTTILQAMTSVYGNPDTDAKLINLWGDTQNSIINRLGYMNNLATAVDEMSNVDPNALHEFLKFVSTGRGKNRLGNGVNNERTNDTTFNLICVVSSNTDFRTVMFADKAKASGEMARFFQVRVSADTKTSKEEADSYFSLLFENYGHAGEIFSQYLIANLDKVKEQLASMQLRIDKELKISGPDRKYSALFAAVFLGAIIAKQLGIHKIPIDNVYKAIGEEFKQSKTEIKQRDFDALQTLGDFLHEAKSCTLVINNNIDKRTGVAEAPIMRPVLDLKVRFEPDTHTIFIPVSIMRSYLESQKVEYTDFIKGLNKYKVLTRKSDIKNLHKGLDISAPGVRCLWIDNANFEQLQIQNLPLDIPKNVN